MRYSVKELIKFNKFERTKKRYEDSVNSNKEHQE